MNAIFIVGIGWVGICAAAVIACAAEAAIIELRAHRRARLVHRRIVCSRSRAATRQRIAHERAKERRTSHELRHT